LQPGDRLWLHPDFPDDQSARYLLISRFCAAPQSTSGELFIKAETWSKQVREEGIVVTVPQDAQQALLFLAPETGGDFGSLRSAVRGRPGVFVRDSQDLNSGQPRPFAPGKIFADVRLFPTRPQGASEIRF